MAAASNSLSTLPLEQLSLYHAVDPFLSSILIFHGPVATAHATVSSSRIQAHIFTPAGFQSYPRIAISPAAPLYAAVNHLPREKQGDEVCRGLAVCILKYFAELSSPVKECLVETAKAGKPAGKVPKLFDEMHAAELANRMTRVENPSEIIRNLREAYRERKVPWIDIDVVLPVGTIRSTERQDSPEDDLDDAPDDQYGKYSPLIQSLGEPIFLPTSRLRRAPSQPTNLSKSKLFSKSQKEALRLAMCEVVDTEERYVAKLYDLVHNVVEEFRAKARARSASSTSPDETALEKLFPPCLNEILEVNMGFLHVIRQILEDTEKDAIADLAGDTELQASVSSRASTRDVNDPVGAAAFANALLEWFPLFSRPYADYMRAHTGFTRTLNAFLRDNNSSFSRRVHETGEQRLRSLLMEPVQRLPRYSLLIDTMTSSLPLVHPAVKPFLKARDVIKDICSLDSSSSTDNSKALELLRALVDDWPLSVSPAGRLITAVDFSEIPPPYRIDSPAAKPSSGLMLLYKDCLIFLSKAQGTKASARGLLAELDQPSPTWSPGELRFARVLDLQGTRWMQSTCGRILYLIPSMTIPEGEEPDRALHVLELSGMYEGRANRLVEEMVKAKIEGRFSEQEREDGKWTLRSPSGTFSNIGILASVFEEDNAGTMKRTGSSNIRIVFDIPKVIRQKTLSSSSDLDVIISISSLDEDQYRLDIDSVVGTSTTDIVSVDIFIPVLSKRLSNLVSHLYHPQHTVMTEPVVYSNFEILRYIAGHLLSQAKVPRGLRPPSPSKMLSSLWGGGQSKETVTPLKSPVPLLGDVPKISPTKSTFNRPDTPSSLTSAQEKQTHRISVVESDADRHVKSLEQTFSAYILSLRSRSGNIVGRILRARDNVDRTAVNELYNILLEDPGKLQAAAEVSVDVLFVSFETFISNAWRDHMGPVIPNSTLELIQSKFDAMFSADFNEFFRQMMGDMSPQNRRALSAMVRLLAELLDASGNDGDRGALTAAFAEVLTESGDPMRYISLLDRLVDDYENLFEDSAPPSASLDGAFPNDSSSALNKSQSLSVSSVNSNTSSFRRRFGFGLHRENSKHEGESKVSSILRTLSKTKGSGESSEPSTPKGTLLRSKSTDTDTRLGNYLRPTSRDRPAVYGIFSDEQERPGSGHSNTLLASIGEVPSHQENPKPRRKRRSSLSDLRPMTASSDDPIPVHTPRPVTPVTPPPQWPRSEVAATPKETRPRSSHASKSPSRVSSPTRTGSPTRAAGTPRRESPTRSNLSSRKENAYSRPTLMERAVNKRSDEPPAPNESPKRKTDMPGTPQRKSAGLRERPTLANGFESPKRPHSMSSPPKVQKLRMQSPQKLRERLANEKKVQAAAEAGFKTELMLIGDELSALKLSPTSDADVKSPNGRAQDANAYLSGRFRDLESRFSSMSADLSGRTTAIEKDLETSLIVSERRAKKLDELYREASAENEALYERFNTELSRVVKDVRLGNGESALKDQLREALEELGRVKKENLRLKREVGGLRAQQMGIPAKHE
ncbi:putative Rho guanyl nucleotide exchange factor [Paecilomyces variotii]|uniref:Putative Rho guanyl nucleotide exchange factor n=1 Tax=Byssochlamys spectabilis TaxID=264951 RepID=A0A443I1T9_BYSSP|nr:putative Rho guanyl nucleotide exchange factor [Paecilomyces variotii]KAJ9222241.1 hypothetical protein DTO169C6_5370 [Paecilomyces variotii]KAJ9253847.1 hypothetical protein DTO207G8_3979 [Paecilomyces variotii]KAJ9362242.1 hypothetical protein DTO280E4_3492 [Paecilomyces variotii]KAJ9392675.1 hypothetical protein DTO063F5_475 [Paecilomyces variotii]RWQ97997.1 putative Rho guanyl nucleotide exchange factor [Paecilomyces variotii]